MDKQTLKDIKLLLIWITMYWDDCDCTEKNIWESDKKFIEIANRYGITKENICDGFTQKEKYDIFLGSNDDE